jgi:transposase-like protein
MAKKRTQWTKETKFRVALEAYKGDREITEIAAEYGVHPNQVRKWKKQLLEAGAEVFSRGRDEEAQRVAAERDELYRKVGHQQVQLDFLKKTLGVENLPNFDR